MVAEVLALALRIVLLCRLDSQLPSLGGQRSFGNHNSNSLRIGGCTASVVELPLLRVPQERMLAEFIVQVWSVAWGALVQSRINTYRILCRVSIREVRMPASESIDTMVSIPKQQIVPTYR